MNVISKCALMGVMAWVQGSVDRRSDHQAESAALLIEDQAQSAPQPDSATAQSPTPKRPAAQPQPQDKSPLIVVHKDTVAPDQHDGRIEVGVMKISSPHGWILISRDVRVPVEAESLVGNTPGMVNTIIAAIPVPDNTLGPGPAMWRLNERLDAEQRLLDAQVDLARAVADRARTCDDRFLCGLPVNGGYGGGGYGGNGWWRNGPRGPVTSTVTQFDDLGSTAQRAYFNAAYPRLNDSQDAHDRAVSRFGRDATPPVVRIQNDVDRARNNASKEHPDGR